MTDAGALGLLRQGAGMRIALTGATGFIGRHVLDRFDTLSMPVVATTRRIASNLPTLRHVRWVELDVHSPGADVYARLGEPDVLIHLAWSGLPNYRSPHHLETELPSHYRLLSQLVAEGLPAMVVAGTCFEYGLQQGELSETSPASPANPYALAKDALRRQLEQLQQQQAFQLTWLRFFYLYGAGQSEKSLFSQLQRAIDEKQSSFDMSGGEQLRDYLPIQEAATYVCQLALLGKDAGIVNVCSGRPVKLRTLVEAWLLRSNSLMRLNLGRYPYPDYEPMEFWGDAKKLRSVLGVS